MKMTFRWYGEQDPVTLQKISQIPGMSGVVTAVYDVPVGEAWSEQSIFALRDACRKHGLAMEVIESVPVHEDIKLGRPTRDRYIENYKTTLLRLGKAGVKCVCYNFMPVFDWLRTDLGKIAADGSNSLSYSHERLLGLDEKNLSLPGWDESYTSDQIAGLLDAYRSVSHEQLFDNLTYFLRAVMPACDEADIDMAIHPDDPPWDIFGLPRIVTSADSYDRMFRSVPDRHNGVTFCTGSLGAGRDNDLVGMAEKYADRIFFAHIRNISWSGERDFTECAHLTSAGDVDVAGVVRALVAAGWDGYVRPDHGRNIWGERGKPGYGLFDRALGACYLNGLFEAYEKELGGKQK